MAKVKIINLKHGDLVTIKGRKGYVGTVGGYAAEDGKDPRSMIKREVDLNARTPYRNGPMYWILQEAACICADPGYYEAQKVKWSAAIPLEDDQLVWLDGALLKVHYKGNYSDMCDFIGAERGACKDCTFGCKLPANMAEAGCPFWTKGIQAEKSFDQLEDTRNGQTYGDF